MPISHIIFHAVLSMMHTLSYPALGHILIWRHLHAVSRRLLKSGQAYSTQGNETSKSSPIHFCEFRQHGTRCSATYASEEKADRTAPPSDNGTAAVSTCSIFSYRSLSLTCFLGASTIWEDLSSIRERHSPLVRHPCRTAPQAADPCPFQADAASTQGSAELHMESRTPVDTGALSEKSLMAEMLSPWHPGTVCADIVSVGRPCIREHRSARAEIVILCPAVVEHGSGGGKAVSRAVYLLPVGKPGICECLINPSTRNSGNPQELIVVKPLKRDFREVRPAFHKRPISVKPIAVAPVLPPVPLIKFRYTRPHRIGEDFVLGHPSILGEVVQLAIDNLGICAHPTSMTTSSVCLFDEIVPGACVPEPAGLHPAVAAEVVPEAVNLLPAAGGVRAVGVPVPAAAAALGPLSPATFAT